MGDSLLIVYIVVIGSLAFHRRTTAFAGEAVVIDTPACLFLKADEDRRLLDKFCSVRSAVDRQVSFLIGDSETRFPGTAL